MGLRGETFFTQKRYTVVYDPDETAKLIARGDVRAVFQVTGKEVSGPPKTYLYTARDLEGLQALLWDRIRTAADKEYKGLLEQNNREIVLALTDLRKPVPA